MMVKWAKDGLLQDNDGKMFVNDGEMLVDDGEMLDNDGEMLANYGEMSIYMINDHTLISQLLTTVSPSLMSSIPSLAWN